MKLSHSKTHYPLRRLPRRRLTTALFAALVASFLVGTSMTPAQAVGTITFTGASAREELVYNGGQVIVDFAFSVERGARAGDTATLQMPELLRIPSTASVPVDSPSGERIATATSNADGTSMLLTLTNYVENHLDVSGSGFISTRISTPDRGEQARTLTFTSGGQNFEDAIVLQPGGTPRPEWVFTRGGWVDRQDRGVSVPAKSMNWQVQTPAGPWTEQIIEFVPEGFTLNCDDIRFSHALTAGTTTQHPAASAFTPITDLEGIETLECRSDLLRVSVTQSVPAGVVLAFDFSGNVIDQSVTVFTGKASAANSHSNSNWLNFIDRPKYEGEGVGNVATPEVSLVKYSTDETSSTGRHPQSPGKTLAINKNESISYLITNVGHEALTLGTLTDDQGITPRCEEFADLQPGSSVTCSAVQPALTEKTTVGGVATVTAVGAGTGITVTASDSWYGSTPAGITDEAKGSKTPSEGTALSGSKAPVVPVETSSHDGLAQTGNGLLTSFIAAVVAAALMCTGTALAWRRRKSQLK